MSINKFEDDSLKQINSINENLALGLFKFFARGKVRKMLKGLQDDPEFQIHVDAINKHTKQLKKDLEAYRKRNPGKKLPWEK